MPQSCSNTSSLKSEHNKTEQLNVRVKKEESYNFFICKVILKGHTVQLTCNEQGRLQLDQVAHSLVQPALECLQGWGTHTSLHNLFQCLTTLIVKNFFLISYLNLPSFSLKPFPLMLSLQTLLKNLFPSSLEPPLRY